jgi:hypothetical protein
LFNCGRALAVLLTLPMPGAGVQPVPIVALAGVSKIDRRDDDEATGMYSPPRVSALPRGTEHLA